MSNSNEMSIYSHPKSNKIIVAKVCSLYDSYVVYAVSCAKMFRYYELEMEYIAWISHAIE